MTKNIQTVNLHQAKTQLSKARGEPFIIAKAGKPLVKVTALDAPATSQMRRLGFMAGQIDVPDDFDTIGLAEIERLFEGR